MLTLVFRKPISKSFRTVASKSSSYEVSTESLSVIPHSCQKHLPIWAFRVIIVAYVSVISWNTLKTSGSTRFPRDLRGGFVARRVLYCASKLFHFAIKVCNCART